MKWAQPAIILKLSHSVVSVLHSVSCSDTGPGLGAFHLIKQARELQCEPSLASDIVEEEVKLG